jgi:hypothetical protein
LAPNRPRGYSRRARHPRGTAPARMARSSGRKPRQRSDDATLK